MQKTLLNNKVPIFASMSLSTKLAWKELILQDGIEKVIGVKMETVWYWRARVRKGYFDLTETAMENHLKKGGWKIAVEREWIKKD